MFRSHVMLGQFETLRYARMKSEKDYERKSKKPLANGGISLSSFSILKPDYSEKVREIDKH